MRKQKKLDVSANHLVAENNNLYEPEEILKYRKKDHLHQYLILWKGYPRSESTWESYKDIQHCTWLFDEWQDKNDEKAMLRLNSSFKSILAQSKCTPKHLKILFKDGKIEWIAAGVVKQFNKQRVYEFYRQQQNKTNDEIYEQYEITQPFLKRNYRKEKRIEKSLSPSPSKIVESRHESPQAVERVSKNFDEEYVRNDIVTNEVISSAVKRMKRQSKQGVLGEDIPHAIQNMVIDRTIGDKSDGYFACDVSWKVRKQMVLPQNTRISRLTLKASHPLLLIQFYEDHLVIEDDGDGDVKQKNNNVQKVRPTEDIIANERRNGESYGDKQTNKKSNGDEDNLDHRNDVVAQKKKPKDRRIQQTTTTSTKWPLEHGGDQLDEKQTEMLQRRKKSLLMEVLN